jgi:hypothetical protein
MSRIVYTIIRVYTSDIRPLANEELKWFQEQPSLLSAIECAALAKKRNGKRYSHQSRINNITLAEAWSVLKEMEKLIGESESFEELFKLIEALIEPIHRASELYIYDTSFRIGAYLGLYPKKIYLHRGTRDEPVALGYDGKQKALDISELHKLFPYLEPYEVEDILCIFKDEYNKSNIKPSTKSISKRSSCG